MTFLDIAGNIILVAVACKIVHSAAKKLHARWRDRQEMLELRRLDARHRLRVNAERGRGGCS